MQKNRWIYTLVLLMTVSLACNFLMGGGSKEAAPQGGAGKSIATQAQGAETREAPALEASTGEPPAALQPGAETNESNTEFPLPANISDFVDLGDGWVNFQANMSVEDAIAFYRESLTKEGYKEREVNTAITDTTFSLVFDGHASGKAIVVQGVDVGGNVNINIRFEDI